MVKTLFINHVNQLKVKLWVYSPHHPHHPLNTGHQYILLHHMCLKPDGLFHLEKTCYLNSVIQCILNCELHSKLHRSSRNNRSDLIIWVYNSLLKLGSIDVAEFSCLLCIA